MTRRHDGNPGSVLAGVTWDHYTVILLKPDCVTRGLVDDVLDCVASEVEIVAREPVTVLDAQIYAHYADIVADRDWFSVDVIAELRRVYIGNEIVVALGRGDTPGTAKRVRALLGHYDPAQAAPETIRGRFGIDSLERSRSEGRLIENLIHTSDEDSVARDFGIWFGANRHELVTTDEKEAAAP